MIYLTLVILALPAAVFYAYDRRMMPVVMRSLALKLLRLWIVAALTWVILLLVTQIWDKPSATTPATSTPMAVTIFLVMAAWAVTTCTRRAMKVVRSSMAAGQQQRDYLLANGSTPREALRPFTRRALRRTVIATLRVPCSPSMLMMVMAGLPVAQAALMATLLEACIMSAPLVYVLFLTQTVAGRKK